MAKPYGATIIMFSITSYKVCKQIGPHAILILEIPFCKNLNKDTEKQKRFLIRNPTEISAVIAW